MHLIVSWKELALLLFQLLLQLLLTHYIMIMMMRLTTAVSLLNFLKKSQI